MKTLLSKFLGLSLKVRAAIIGAVALIIALSGALGWTYYKGRADEHAVAQPKIEMAQDQASVSELNAAGALDSAHRVEVVVREARDAYQVTSDLALEASKAEDANAPLDPARAARLHAADQRLCDTRPSLVGCEPAGGDAEAR